MVLFIIGCFAGAFAGVGFHALAMMASDEENGQEKMMSGKRISGRLVLVLAGIAAVVATGLIAGYNMYPWIVGYWVVLTTKNIVDYIDDREKEKSRP